MAVTTAMCHSAKLDAMNGAVDFGAFTYKVALIKTAEAGTYNAASTNYSDITGNTDESTATTGYTAGGATLTAEATFPKLVATSTAVMDWVNTPWTVTGTLASNGCMIYTTDATAGTANRAFSVHAFSGSPSATDGTFTINWPTGDQTNGIHRLA